MVRNVVSVIGEFHLSYQLIHLDVVLEFCFWQIIWYLTQESISFLRRLIVIVWQPSEHISAHRLARERKFWRVTCRATRELPITTAQAYRSETRKCWDRFSKTVERVSGRIGSSFVQYWGTFGWGLRPPKICCFFIFEIAAFWALLGGEICLTFIEVFCGLWLISPKIHSFQNLKIL